MKMETCRIELGFKCIKFNS
jgi:hypothetical protein